MPWCLICDKTTFDGTGGADRGPYQLCADCVKAGAALEFVTSPGRSRAVMFRRFRGQAWKSAAEALRAQVRARKARDEVQQPRLFGLPAENVPPKAQ